MTPWTAHPKAAALLADCAARPPVKVVHVDRFRDTWATYSNRDERIRKLNELYANAQPPLDTPAWREWLELTPQVAIDHLEAKAVHVREVVGV